MPSSGNPEELFFRACDLWEAGNATKAFQLFAESAREGYVSAQANLGVFYEEGIGTNKNEKMAYFWYKKAAEEGGIGAMMNLAELCRKNDRKEEAISWLDKAILLGDGDAALQMAKLLMEDQDPSSARRYLEIAIHSTMITEAALQEASQLVDALGD